MVAESTDLVALVIDGGRGEQALEDRLELAAVPGPEMAERVVHGLRPKQSDPLRAPSTGPGEHKADRATVGPGTANDKAVSLEVVDHPDRRRV